MTSLDEPLAPLLRSAQDAPAPIVALQLRQATYQRDRAGQLHPAARVLERVLARPSHDDSRYEVDHLDTLPATTPEQTADALALGQRLATQLGVPLHLCDSRSTGWVARQPPPPERPWALRWRTVTWLDDGTEQRAAGEQLVLASTGREAIAEVERQLLERLRTPCDYRVGMLDLEGSPLHGRRGPTSPALPSTATLRAGAHEGRTPSELLEAMARQAPASTVLERMTALEAAFDLDLTGLAPVAVFHRGELATSALDEALAPLLARTRPRWSLPVELVRAHAAGRSLGPLLRSFHEEHGVGSIHICVSLREAFALPLREAKELTGTACSGQEDEAFEAALRGFLAARTDSGPG